MSAFDRLKINPQKFTAGTNHSLAQAQTKDTFSFKWHQRHTYESDSVKETCKKWLFERYCHNDPTKLDAWLSEKGGKKLILDAGCGSGFSAMLFFGAYLNQHDYLGVDISEAINIAKERFLEHGYSGDFLQCNLFDLPVPDNSLDLIFSEGVLHHTDSTEKAIKYLALKLKPGGRFLFYVYGKKAVIREFTDDFIREQLKGLTDLEAWKALESLTKLGIALGELNIDFEVPDDIPFLGIKKGKINLQRFFYWNICKMYYRSDWTFDEMNHINFDWFRPLNCHKQTPEEVTRWVIEAGLEVEHMDVQEAGITIVGRKITQFIR